MIIRLLHATKPDLLKLLTNSTGLIQCRSGRSCGVLNYNSSRYVNLKRLIRRLFQFPSSRGKNNGDSRVSPARLWIFIFATTSATIGLTVNSSSGQNVKYVTSCQQQQQENSHKEKDKTRMCADWCASVNDESTPCRMDESIVPCKGKHCQTTCGLWNLFVLPQKNRPVTCEMYKSGLAYPIGAKPCDPKCLIPEVSPRRYPEPTGLGVFCRPNTCSPGATPNPKCPNFGKLQCPCNWFGSECSDDWVPIQRLDRQWIGGEEGKEGDGGRLLKVTLHLPTDQWKTLIKDWRPGGILRLHYSPSKKRRKEHDANSKKKQHAEDETHRLYEMSCAVASANTPGQLDILVAKPDPSMRPEVRKIAELLRSTSKSSSSFHVQDLYANPSISGFFNTRYEYLLQVFDKHNNNRVLTSSSPKINNLVFVSSGAGLAGVLPAVEAIVFNKDDRNKSHLASAGDKEDHGNDIVDTVHLFHQVCDYSQLPYKDRIERLLETGKVKLTLIETSPTSSRNNKISMPSSHIASGTEHGCDDGGGCPLVIAALERGLKAKEEVTMRLKSTNGTRMTPTTKKVYVQDVFFHDIEHEDQHVSLASTAVVVCGHLQIMNDMQNKLSKSRQMKGISLDDWMHERFFLNI